MRRARGALVARVALPPRLAVARTIQAVAVARAIVQARTARAPRALPSAVACALARDRVADAVTRAAAVGTGARLRAAVLARVAAVTLAHAAHATPVLVAAVWARRRRAVDARPSAGAQALAADAFAVLRAVRRAALVLTGLSRVAVGALAPRGAARRDVGNEDAHRMEVALALARAERAAGLVAPGPRSVDAAPAAQAAAATRLVTEPCSSSRRGRA